MFDEVVIKIERTDDAVALPVYAHGPDEDAGLDLCAAESLDLPAGEVRAVGTGLRIELPAGYEAQVRPRSGLALKSAVTVANSPGTIDPGYRGEIKVILINHGKRDFRIERGARVGQLVVSRYSRVRWRESSLDASTRGSGGFGSTGR